VFCLKKKRVFPNVKNFFLSGFCPCDQYQRRFDWRARQRLQCCVTIVFLVLCLGTRLIRIAEPCDLFLQNLLKVRVDVNLRDYQGASPLHRAKTIPTLEVSTHGVHVVVT